MTGASIAALVAGQALAAQPAAPTTDAGGTATAPATAETAATPMAPAAGDAAAQTAGAGDEAQPAEAQQPRIQRAALEVETQAVKDGQVTIDMAWMPGAGFVVLHPLENDRLSPDTMGHAPLVEGDNENVAIELDGDVTEPTVVVAMLHRDTGQAGTYEFGANAMDEDAPELIGGRPIAAAFQILPEVRTEGATSEQGALPKAQTGAAERHEQAAAAPAVPPAVAAEEESGDS